MKTNTKNYKEIDVSKLTGDKKLSALWHLMYGYHLNFIVANLFTALAALARTGMYLYLGDFIDRMIESGIQGDTLLKSALSFGALITLQALSSFISSWMANIHCRKRDTPFA